MNIYCRINSENCLHFISKSHMSSCNMCFLILIKFPLAKYHQCLSLTESLFTKLQGRESKREKLLKLLARDKLLKLK